MIVVLPYLILNTKTVCFWIDSLKDKSLTIIYKINVNILALKNFGNDYFKISRIKNFFYKILYQVQA